MCLSIFKGMSDGWQCTSFQIPQWIVLWGINNIYCHIWALLWAKGLPFLCFVFLLLLFFFFICMYMHLYRSAFLVTKRPSRPSGQLSVISKLWELLNVLNPRNSWPSFIVGKSILSFPPPRGHQPQYNRMGYPSDLWVRNPFIKGPWATYGCTSLGLHSNLSRH